MNIFKSLLEWKKRKENSDIHKIDILPNGGFEMKSENLFSNKEETLKYCETMNELFEKIKGKSLDR